MALWWLSTLFIGPPVQDDSGREGAVKSHAGAAIQCILSLTSRYLLQPLELHLPMIAWLL